MASQIVWNRNGTLFSIKKPPCKIHGGARLTEFAVADGLHDCVSRNNVQI